ncbi:FAD-binding oxidoreductase [uncultured Roseibium sp.]|uniref:FAD-binding oxidoreductase n=1 Tax=uncultured Roseibium sp. TaxID=1936171 RepID=UPI00374CD7F3
MTLIDRLRQSGEDLGLLTETGDKASYLADGTRREGSEPSIVIRPKTTASVSFALKTCHEFRQPVALQGGLTGLSGGARPRAGEVVLSLERMSALEAVDQEDASVIAEAGVSLQAVQEAADRADLMVGVDIGARGSATIGGAISTNAGGIRVLRYGMFREQVTGVEVVLADGTIVSSMRGLAKDNTGLDLRHLVIGTEGTYGVVTRARLRLHPKPSFSRNALCAVSSADGAMDLLKHMRGALGPTLSAFEGIWPETYEGAATFCGIRPLETGAELYVLLEMQGFGNASNPEALEDALMKACDKGLCSDCVVSQSGRDFDNIWAVREACPEYTFSLGRLRGHDISLPPQRIRKFVEVARREIARIDPGATVHIYGHLGDGNLHFILNSGVPDQVSPAIYRLAAEFGGTISAEHGVGFDKTPYLPLVRSEKEIDLMRRVKQVLDPEGLLNPGRIFS